MLGEALGGKMADIPGRAPIDDSLGMGLLQSPGAAFHALASPRRFSLRAMLALLFMLLTGLLAPSGATGTPRQAGAEIITAGSEIDFPPYAITDAQGQADGFSVELLRAVAEAMDLRVSFRTGEWNTVWEALKRGEIDGLPLVARSAERAEYAEFTVPHTVTYDSFFVRNGSPSLTSLAEAEGKEIIVMRGDAAHEELVRHGFHGRLILVASIPEAMRLLASGRHHAVLVSKLIGHMVLRDTKLDGVILSGPPLTEYRREFAFAVRKGDAALKDRLEQGIAIVKATGRYDEIHRKWLGVLEPPHIKIETLAWWLGIPSGIALVILAWALSLRREIRLRRRHEQALRESEERLRAIVDTAVDAIVVIGEDGIVQSANPATERILGYAPEEIVGRNVSVLMPEPYRSAHAGYIGTYLRAGEAHVIGLGREVDVCGKDGKAFPADLAVAEWRAGGKRYFTATMRDISERRKREEQVDLLLREVNHRSKNMLSIVQAIASQTAASSREDFIARFQERIQALAANQDVLVRSQWQNVGIEDLLHAQLAHFEGFIGSRILAVGPALSVAAEAAQPISMALHELATNAGKYGALSNDAGVVAIAWGIERSGAGERFHLSWTESGGPAVAPPLRRGFGTKVITLVPQSQLDAEVTYEFPSNGVMWSLSCPAPNVLERGWTEAGNRVPA